MRYGSVCSGVEAATLAWEPLGWEAAFFAEVEPFPCAVLQQRFGATRPLRALIPEDAENTKCRKRQFAGAKCSEEFSLPFIAACDMNGSEGVDRHEDSNSGKETRGKCMSEIAVECLECEAEYYELLTQYRKLKEKCRRMRRSFAAIEYAVLHKPQGHNEFVVGECEAHRGKYRVGY